LNKFSIHGECNLSVDRNILTINITGPCNKEFFFYLHQKLLSVADKININNYAVLLIPHGDAVIIFDAFLAHVEFLKSKSVKAIAVVLESCSTPSMTKSMCHKAYENADIVHQFFENRAAAKNWLNDEILYG